jgi:hypothetical protein
LPTRLVPAGQARAAIAELKNSFKNLVLRAVRGTFGVYREFGAEVAAQRHDEALPFFCERQSKLCLLFNVLQLLDESRCIHLRIFLLRNEANEAYQNQKLICQKNLRCFSAKKSALFLSDVVPTPPRAS